MQERGTNARTAEAGTDGLNTLDSSKEMHRFIIHTHEGKANLH